MKTNIIDTKKLIHVILKGESSYSDGRHDFNYEKLREALMLFDIKINTDSAHERIREISSIKNNRRNLNHQDYNLYIFSLHSDSNLHYEAVFHTDIDMPYTAMELNEPINREDLTPGIWLYQYQTHGRHNACELLKYIKAVHPGYRNLAIHKTTKYL